MNTNGGARVDLRSENLKLMSGTTSANSVSVKHGSNAGSCSEAKRFRVVRNSQTKQCSPSWSTSITHWESLSCSGTITV